MKNNINTKSVLSVLGVLALVLVTAGVSYAFFTYSKQGNTINSVTTGTLAFSYNESTTEGNGITLTNAMPLADNLGMALTGSAKTFDFTISSTVVGATINYEVVAIKEAECTLPDNAIKIYLTEVNGVSETAAPLTSTGGVVKKYSELETNAKGGANLYKGTFNGSPSTVTKNFRLRMWVASDATTISGSDWVNNNKTFKVKVGVNAVS